MLYRKSQLHASHFPDVVPCFVFLYAVIITRFVRKLIFVLPEERFFLLLDIQTVDYKYFFIFMSATIMHYLCNVKSSKGVLGFLALVWSSIVRFLTLTTKLLAFCAILAKKSSVIIDVLTTSEQNEENASKR